MGRKRTSGLLNRKGIWHIDKKILGQRICESSGSDSLEEAEIYLAKRIEEIRQAKIYGIRLQRTFKEAAIRYLLENKDKSSIKEVGYLLKHLDKFIGDLPLESIHIGSLQNYIVSRETDSVKKKTINQGLEIVRRILNRAAGEWVDENGMTWLATAPKIKLLAETDKRKPFPINWDEQKRLFAELPLHLRRMALFAVNTGCRDKEICRLQWDWEVKVPELNTSVFIIPGEKVKNRQDRLVVLNRIAGQVIQEARGLHSIYVFPYQGRCVTRMSNSAWKKARIRAGLSQVRVHDLKHTFGRRLRAVGVDFEDRQDLLGHKSGRITTHYSQVELINLIQAVNKVCEEGNRKPVLTVLRRVA
jgi:integrase